MNDFSAISNNDRSDDDDDDDTTEATATKHMVSLCAKKRKFAPKNTYALCYSMPILELATLKQCCT